MRTDIKTLKHAKELLRYKNKLDHINKMIASYTHDWVDVQLKIIKLEEELKK